MKYYAGFYLNLEKYRV